MPNKSDKTVKNRQKNRVEILKKEQKISKIG